MEEALEADDSAAEAADIRMDKAKEARAEEMGQASATAIFLAPKTTFTELPPTRGTKQADPETCTYWSGQHRQK